MSFNTNHFLSLVRNIAGVCIIVAFMLCSADMGAQSKKVTLVSASSTVGQALKDIESQTGYLFVYNTSDVDVTRKVTLNYTDMAVSQVLESLLADQGLKWNLEGRYIKILKPGPEQNAAGKGTANGPVQIRGKVSGPDGEPLIGASLMIKGTTTGVITDTDGSFNMEIPSGEAVLTVSYLGFVDKEVETRGKQYFDIVLQEDTNTLEELVVIGYGTARKVDLTGSVGSVDGKTIAGRKSNSVAASLQGAMAGVTVTRTSNEPSKESGDIKVRGITTMSDSSPLILVDNRRLDSACHH